MSGDWKTECQYCGKRMKDIDEAMDHANNCDGDLRECPFCGAEATVDVWGKPHYQKCYARCKGCAAEGPWGKNKGAAVALWNKRVNVS